MVCVRVNVYVCERECICVREREKWEGECIRVYVCERENVLCV